jgi:acyl dehydratase
MINNYGLEPIIMQEITHTQLVKYAGASGDFNPIHTVVPKAEEAGLGGVIAHGMLIMGFMGRAITQWFSSGDLADFSVRFKAMTKPGEHIIVTGRVVEELADRLVCEAEAVNKDGEVKVKGFFEMKK